MNNDAVKSSTSDLEMTEINVRTLVGEKIRFHRKKAHLTLEALSELVDGISLQQLQKYETGVNRVTCERVYQFSQVLGVPVSSFFPKPPYREAVLSLSEDDTTEVVHEMLCDDQVQLLLLTLSEIEGIKRDKVIQLCRKIVEFHIRNDDD